jgi:hypothetical protein
MPDQNYYRSSINKVGSSSTEQSPNILISNFAITEKSSLSIAVLEAEQVMIERDLQIF